MVVLTNPVENVTDTPSIEAQQNAVSFSFTAMTIDEVCCLPDKVIIQSIPYINLIIIFAIYYNGRIVRCLP